MDVNFMERGKAEVKPTFEFTTELLESPNMLFTGSEGATLSDGGVKVDRNEIGDADEGRVPARAIDTTI